MEKWRDINGYEGLYQISNFGRIKSFHFGNNKGRLRTLIPDQDGYLQVNLSNVEKVIVKHRVHRLVSNAFIQKEKSEQTQVNHIDGNPGNNHVSNLEWCTPQENIDHSRYVLGNNPTGPENKSSRWYEVTHPDGRKEIILNMAEFCRKYNLYRGSTANVVNGKHHTHKGYRIRKLGITKSIGISND